MEKKYNLIQSVGRAFSILEQFSADERELGVTTLAARVGLHKSTCFGLLYTLQELGYIQQNPDTGRYSLGLKAFELGQLYIQGQDIRQLAKPYLRRLVEQTEETAHLVVMEGLRAVYIDKVEGPHSMTISSRIGRQARMHCSGVGKVLLANMREADRNEVLNNLVFVRNTVHTITDKDVLREHLRQIREQGYAIDAEEIEIGLCCVAAPVFNSRNQAVAAVSVSGPSVRLMGEKLAVFTKQVQETAQEISRQLGNGTQGYRANSLGAA